MNDNVIEFPKINNKTLTINEILNQLLTQEDIEHFIGISIHKNGDINLYSSIIVNTIENYFQALGLVEEFKNLLDDFKIILRKNIELYL